MAALRHRGMLIGLALLGLVLGGGAASASNQQGSRPAPPRLYPPRKPSLTPAKRSSTTRRALNRRRLPAGRKIMDSPAQQAAFPRLGSNYEVLALGTPKYNCISWSLGVTNKWIWPGKTVADFDRLYTSYGYKRAPRRSYSRQTGLDKVVLYGKVQKDGKVEVTHAARQFPDGSWSSKLGKNPLIRHMQPVDVAGPSYGVPIAVYTRPHSRKRPAVEVALKRSESSSPTPAPRPPEPDFQFSP